MHCGVVEAAKLNIAHLIEMADDGRVRLRVLHNPHALQVLLLELLVVVDLTVPAARKMPCFYTAVSHYFGALTLEEASGNLQGQEGA